VLCREGRGRHPVKQYEGEHSSGDGMNEISWSHLITCKRCLEDADSLH
jgi:hypothetical protein